MRWRSDDTWHPKTWYKRPSSVEGNYAVYNTVTGDYEFYDDWYGISMNTNGIMRISQGRNGKERDFKSSIYIPSLELQI